MKPIRIGPKKPRKKAVLIPKKNAPKTLTRADFKAIYAEVAKTLKKQAAYIRRMQPRRSPSTRRFYPR